MIFFNNYFNLRTQRIQREGSKLENSSLYSTYVKWKTSFT